MKTNWNRRGRAVERAARASGAAAGFTLIELMVVIVIIGLLVALVGPRLMGAADDAKVVAAKAQIHSFMSALDLYKLKMPGGKYPTTGEGLQALITNGKRNFLNQDSIPVDPWNNEYVYTSPGAQGHDYEIVSYGADGAPGGTGEYDADIQSWNLQDSGN
ncbi:MAG: type II secretion system major pseudopilin GspG [Candidatus Hydrogenedentes bacterium]|nr:type II secretion system major pseudopilin GspG [Candidatus Hydrogenedentota bacterium]